MIRGPKVELTQEWPKLFEITNQNQRKSSTIKLLDVTGDNTVASELLQTWAPPIPVGLT